MNLKKLTESLSPKEPDKFDCWIDEMRDLLAVSDQMDRAPAAPYTTLRRATDEDIAAARLELGEPELDAFERWLMEEITDEPALPTLNLNRAGRGDLERSLKTYRLLQKRCLYRLWGSRQLTKFLPPCSNLRSRECPECRGTCTGLTNGIFGDCYTCNGIGEIRNLRLLDRAIKAIPAKGIHQERIFLAQEQICQIQVELAQLTPPCRTSQTSQTSQTRLFHVKSTPKSLT